MTDDIEEVWTDCPDCGAEIPFYRTVDEDGRCPECGTDADKLFDMAIGSQPIEPAGPAGDSALALTDGGRGE